MINPTDAALKAVHDALQHRDEEMNEGMGVPSYVDAPGSPVRDETPSWGEEAAASILRMAGDRADYVSRFGQDVVKRAEAWKKVADQLADDIRATAEKEAEAVRRETARMHKAGMRIEVAMREFSPEPEKYNGRDRRTSEASGSNSPDGAEREPIPGTTKARAHASIDRTGERSTEGGVDPVPEFLQKGPAIPSGQFKPRGFA
jgi:hypothetical protein